MYTLHKFFSPPRKAALSATTFGAERCYLTNDVTNEAGSLRTVGAPTRRRFNE